MSRASIVPAALALLAGSALTHAQTIEWGGAPNGVWSDPLNWSPNNVPDSLAESALLALNTPYYVICNVSPSIAELHVTNPLAELEIDPARILTVNGPAATNNGIIHVNFDNSAADAYFNVGADTLLGGTGEMQLHTNTSNSRLSSGAGVVLTNGPDHTIRGVGWLSAGLDNQGTVLADVSIALSGAELQLNVEDKSNAGIIAAADGSQLEISGITLDQSAGGTLLAMDGGVIEAAASTIIGGTFESEGSGALSTIGSFTADSMTFNGSSFVNAAHIMSVVGSALVNNGAMHINEQNSAADAYLTFQESGTLGGTGQVVLRTIADNSRVTTAPEAVITHGAEHTITGAGFVSAALVNLGEIRADVTQAISGDEIYLLTADKTNLGVMSAAPDSTLRIDAVTIDQSGEGESGMLVADADGAIAVYNNATIVGGLVTGEGALTTLGNAALVGVLLEADTFANAGHVLSIAGSGITNEGVITINDQNSAADAYLNAAEDTVINGSGEIRMRTNSNNSRISTDIDAALVHGPDHLIRGVGWIEADILNLGEIRADASVALSGTALDLLTNDKINDGLIVASPGSQIQIFGVVVDQTGGGMLLAEDTGAVVLATNAEIDAGTFQSAGSGALTTTGNAALRDMTLEGTSFVNAGNTLAILGAGVTNDGLMTLNEQNSAADAYLSFPESGVIQGDGEIRMRTGSNNSRISSGEEAIILHAQGHTIRGVGWIEAALHNQGTVIADAGVALSGTDLNLRGADKVNDGVMRAMPGSQLIVDNITLDQSGEGASGVIEVMAEGLVQPHNAVFVGGEINGDGALSTLGSSTISGVTLNADAFVNPGHVLSVTDDVTNNALINVNPQNSAADAFLHFPEGGLLAGSGTLLLNADVDNARLSAGDDMTVTNGPDHTIAGTGDIEATLVNQGRIAPGAGAFGEVDTLNASEPVAFTASGVLAVDAGATADRLTVNAPVELAGTVEVSLVDGHVPGECDSYVILSATSLEGAFDALVAPDAGPGLRYRLFQDATTVQLRATCLADVNADCQLNILDFVAFQALFQAGSEEADCNGDTNLNILDFVCYQGLFQAGCP